MTNASTMTSDSGHASVRASGHSNRHCLSRSEGGHPQMKAIIAIRVDDEEIQIQRCGTLLNIAREDLIDRVEFNTVAQAVGGKPLMT
uniref:Ferredoxin n=1 Tax=Panagrellus redivivus TaxID=6233 RepID=A0A7E4VE08_PANRE